MTELREAREEEPKIDILRNQAECEECGDFLISRHRHEFKTCYCGNLSVDGGTDYIRRIFLDKTTVREANVGLKTAVPVSVAKALLGLLNVLSESAWTWESDLPTALAEQHSRLEWFPALSGDELRLTLELAEAEELVREDPDSHEGARRFQRCVEIAEPRSVGQERALRSATG